MSDVTPANDSFMKIFSYIIVFSILLFGLATATLHHLYTAPGPLAEPKTVFIEKGAGVRGITRQLVEEGVIHHALLVAVPAVALDKHRDFKPGEYLFLTGITPGAVIDMLAGGKIVIHKLTIPEGLTSRDVVAMVQAEPLLTDSIEAIPDEGSLLPETYHFERGDSRQELITRMQRDMRKAQSELWQARAEGLPFSSIREAVILASIVEKEARLAEERTHIASVYINRLHKGMKLQADPTTIYAIELEQGKKMERLLLKKDLLRDLPHNTYMREGLPPTPIANPGRASIAAVLSPKQTTDIFFVARGDGGHYFAKTYKEHQRNIQQYKRNQNQP